MAAKKKTRAKAKSRAKANGAKKLTALKKAYTKTELITEISTNTGLGKKEVNSVFEALAEVVERHVKKNGVGQFTLPGLLKIKTKKKPATKAHKRPNPFSPGEMMTVKAKPARMVVKILPLKNLKTMVS